LVYVLQIDLCHGSIVHLTIFRDFYEPYALMLGEEAMVVSGLLIGLNIIDCNMVLKDDDDLDRPVSEIILKLCKQAAIVLVKTV
jgi:hypothetical protein